ncbi:MAG: pantetheine-phosphate adenylyltransferase [Cardiobacteriaceae bacterium]|nr:pantetheine-phosphate adenylyltransferase [Cardiobacteriaceae bacterium]
MRIALYPGTFDPLTVGHQNIIERASRLCDHLYIAVARAHHKNTLFSAEERLDALRAVLPELDTATIRIDVISFDGLLADLYRDCRADFVVRGLRNTADFEYERQLGAMNRQLLPGLETVFLATAENFFHISSTLVREAAKLGGNIDDFVHPIIKKNLQDKFLQHGNSCV